MACLVALLVLSGKTAAQSERSEVVLSIGPTSILQREAWLSLMKDFEREHPDIRGRVSSLDHERFKDRVMSTESGLNRMGDVVTWAAGERLKTLVDQQRIEPIDFLLSADQWQQWFSPAVQALITVDNSRYGIPFSYYQWGFYYHRALFEKLGLEVPQDWQQFKTVVQKLRAARKVPIALGYREPWTLAGWFDYLNLRLNGLEFHIDFLEGRIDPRDARILEIFRYWRELLAIRAFAPNAGRIDWRESLPFVFRQLAGMTLMGNFFVGNIPESLRDSLGFFPFPDIRDSAPVYEEAPMDVLVLARNARNPEAAARFLKYVADPQVQQRFNDRVGMVSPHRNATTASHLFLPEARALLDSAEGLSQFLDRDAPPAWGQAIIRSLEAFMKNPESLDGELEALALERAKLFPDHSSGKAD